LKLLVHELAQKKWHFLDKSALGFREIALWDVPSLGSSLSVILPLAKRLRHFFTAER
jgi:hypothetical protein